MKAAITNNVSIKNSLKKKTNKIGNPSQEKEIIKGNQLETTELEIYNKKKKKLNGQLNSKNNKWHKLVILRTEFIQSEQKRNMTKKKLTKTQNL